MRLIVLAALMLSTLGAQPYPAGEALLRKSETAARNLRSLQFHDETTTETRFTGQPQFMTDRSDFFSATVFPGKARIELKSEDDYELAISDSQSAWIYSSNWHEFTRISAAGGPEGIMALTGIEDMMPKFPGAASTAKTIGQESVTIEGQKHACWIVEIHVEDGVLPGPKNNQINGIVHTHWFDKQSGLDLQSTFSMKAVTAEGPLFDLRGKTVRKSMQIDAPIADSTFVFTPPADAREVAKLSMFGGQRYAVPDLVGKAAPPIAGQKLQGKPLLIHFVAAWCATCRQSKAALDRIIAEYKDGDLTVLAVDAGEDRNAATLRDYSVALYPTFVLIGADGKVAASEIGFSGEETLRVLLQKGGLSNSTVS